MKLAIFSNCQQLPTLYLSRSGVFFPGQVENDLRFRLVILFKMECRVPKSSPRNLDNLIQGSDRPGTLDMSALSFPSLLPWRKGKVVYIIL